MQIGRHRLGAGIRANCENSSTSPFSDSTSPTMVEVHSSTSARVRRRRRAEMRCRRSADSWIGVSGFLISCARRRATSRHAATFCARISGVTSSKTSTVPSMRPSSPASGVATAARCSSRPSRTSATSCAGGSPLPARGRPKQRRQRREVVAREHVRRAAADRRRRSTPSSRAAGVVDGADRARASIETTPVAMRSRIVSM